MRRLLLVVAVLVFGSMVRPPAPALAGGRPECEVYCGALVIACYVAVGLIVGQEKCDAQYEGCMAGCLAIKKKRK